MTAEAGLHVERAKGRDAVQRGQLVFKLLFPLAVALAALATPVVWLRRGGGLRAAFGAALLRCASVAVALGALVVLIRSGAPRGAGVADSAAGPPRLSRVDEEVVYEPGFPGTIVPRLTPFQPGSEGSVFLLLLNRVVAWTYILERWPDLDSLPPDRLPSSFRRGNTDLWVLEVVSVNPADSPRRWPPLHSSRDDPGPPRARQGDYAVLGDPQVAYARAGALIKLTPDLDHATSVATGFAKVYGVSTCVCRLLECRSW